MAAVPATAFSAIKERITPSRFQGLTWLMSAYPTLKVPARFMILKTVNDFAGNYAAAQAGFAIRGGQSEVSMRNGKGVTVIVLANEGKESGTRLSLGPSGVSFMLK